MTKLTDGDDQLKVMGKKGIDCRVPPNRALNLRSIDKNNALHSKYKEKITVVKN
jgi:hypothetical protein